ncbi:P-loop containing nucleoside triphosphate hydrolase protein [Russula aff. rugulosa BPL654]|nr:P-loop containing nucleoside triphosphate hydrolase protein [Russula aff. rugulosa BPL654]
MRRELMKPRIQDNDFSTVDREHDGTLIVNNTRFKTRIRASRQTHLELCMDNGDVVNATIKGAKGRQSSARTAQPLKGDVAHIRVIGREERTNAEQLQYRFLLSALAGAGASSTPLFVNRIWFPRADNTQDTGYDKNIRFSCDHESQTLQKLNNSQREIVGAMLSSAPQDSLVIAHGPPGTGKTTTIAAAAAIWVSRKLPCWIIAQSNVGVKNIAEKLVQKEVDFRLIVSQEFYFEWHERLYEKIQDKVIRSDDLPDSVSDVSKTFRGITVVLCTLSMLSNPKLADCGLIGILPLTSLVVDEASQIDVFEFMHLFYTHSKKLTKVCFFGDPKQLPPYGSGEAGLETIFDIKHLKKKSYFLDTQYRLPVHLGSFISENVYNGKLRSRHSIADYSCIAFIDVWKGEELRQGSSFKVS